MKRQLVLIATTAVISLATVLASQPIQNSKLSARELYYRPVKKTVAATTASNRGAAPGAVQTAAASPNSGKMEPVSSMEATPGADVALAMRYRILKKKGAAFEEVDTDTTFSSGDTIRISIAVNSPAYLYIAQIGSSGKWNVLVPDSAENDKSIKGYVDVEFPSGGYGFTFDTTPGTEQVFVAASRQPIGNLEQVVNTRNSPRQSAPATPAGQSKPVVMVSLDPSVIDGLRLQARDLVIQKVDTVANASQEHAIYIASAPSSNNDLVIADLKLNHQR